MSGSELHVAIEGLVDAGPDVVKPQLAIVLQRDGFPVLNDQLVPEITIKTTDYLTPAEFNAAVLNAAVAHLAAPDGWNVTGPFNATFLYGGAAPSAVLLAALVAAVAGTPAITVAIQAGAARAATIQLKDAALANLAAKACARVWISDAAAGAPAATAPDGGVAISGGVAIVTVVANKVFDVVSSAAGAIVVTLTESGVGPTTWYVNVAIGNHVASAAVAIAN